MGSEGSANTVGLPNVQFGAARSVLASARVGVTCDGLPVFRVSLAGNPLDVVRALGVAIARTVLGTSLVAWVSGGTFEKKEP